MKKSYEQIIITNHKLFNLLILLYFHEKHKNYF